MRPFSYSCIIQMIPTELALICVYVYGTVNERVTFESKDVFIK